MTRFHCWLFDLAAAVLLVVCVATVALWVRSYFVSDVIGWHHGRIDGENWTHWDEPLQSSTGHIHFYRQTTEMSNYYKFPPGDFRAATRALGGPDGFWYESREPLNGWEYFRTYPADLNIGGYIFINWVEKRFAVAYAVLVVFFLSILSIILWYRSRSFRRARAGCCTACGYDLRASRDRCPECGTPIPKSLSAGAAPIDPQSPPA